MAVYRPTYKDQKTGKQKQSRQWWYEFSYAGKRIRESAKTARKTLAIEAEKNRRLELERGLNSLEDRRRDRIRTVSELAKEFLDDYSVRHPSDRFAKYALAPVVEKLGDVMLVDVSERDIVAYQTARLKEKAGRKTINEEVVLFLRIPGESGDFIRARLRKARALKLRVRGSIGKAYSVEQKAAMVAAARDQKKSPATFPALSLALNAGMRDAEIRGLQWGRVDLVKPVLTVGESKTEAGEGRTIPLNSWFCWSTRSGIRESLE
jgi:integrase